MLRERAIAIVEVHMAGGVIATRKKIHPAVVVEVAGGSIGTAARMRHPGFSRQLGKGVIAVVAVEIGLWVTIGSDVKVKPTVIVVIDRGHAHAVVFVKPSVKLDAGARRGDVREGPVAVVLPELVRKIPALGLLVLLREPALIDIGPSVVVVVQEDHRVVAALIPEPRRERHVAKRPVTVIVVERLGVVRPNQRTLPVRYDQVHVPIPVVVAPGAEVAVAVIAHPCPTPDFFVEGNVALHADLTVELIVALHAACPHEQVCVAVVVVICRSNPANASVGADSGDFRHVLEGDLAIGVLAAANVKVVSGVLARFGNVKPAIVIGIEEYRSMSELGAVTLHSCLSRPLGKLDPAAGCLRSRDHGQSRERRARARTEGQSYCPCDSNENTISSPHASSPLQVRIMN